MDETKCWCCGKAVTINIDGYYCYTPPGLHCKDCCPIFQGSREHDPREGYSDVIPLSCMERYLVRLSEEVSRRNRIVSDEHRAVRSQPLWKTSLARGMGHRAIAHVLASHGRFFVGGCLAPNLALGPPGDCFRTAEAVAVRSRDSLAAVTGYGFSSADAFCQMHSWCADKNGRAFDFTWGYGLVYFGVPWSTEFVRECSGNPGSALDFYAYNIVRFGMPPDADSLFCSSIGIRPDNLTAPRLVEHLKQSRTVEADIPIRRVGLALGKLKRSLADIRSAGTADFHEGPSRPTSSWRANPKPLFAL